MSNLQTDVEKLNIKHKRKGRWYRLMSILAAIVVFCTTYALILPAITMEKKTYCGITAFAIIYKMYVQQPTKSFCNNLHFSLATFYKKGLQKTVWHKRANHGRRTIIRLQTPCTDYLQFTLLLRI
jgi:hypothetical protein